MIENLFEKKRNIKIFHQELGEALRFIRPRIFLILFSVLIACILWFLVVNGTLGNVERYGRYGRPGYSPGAPASEPEKIQSGAEEISRRLRVRLPLSVQKNVPDQYVVKPAYVLAIGSREALHNVGEVFVDAADLARVEEGQSRTVKLRLPSSAEYRLSDPNIVIYKKTVSEISQTVKTVGVFVRTVGTLPKGYDLLSARAEPSSINVQGNMDALKKLSMLNTKKVDLTGITQNVSLKRALVEIPEGVTPSQSAVVPNVRVKKKTAENLLQNVALKVRSKEAGAWSLSPDTVTVFAEAPEEKLAGVNLASAGLIPYVDFSNIVFKEVRLPVRLERNSRFPDVDFYVRPTTVQASRVIE